MARYTAAQIYAFALEAGFDQDSATTMTAVALAESGGRGSAHATHGEDSRGLWQINAAAHPDLAARYDLFDPRQNALAAFSVSDHGSDISPWTTTHGGARAPYLRHKEAAQAAAVAHGDPAGLGVWSGTDGYGDPLPAGGSQDPEPAPVLPSGVNTFEAATLAGTDPGQAGVPAPAPGNPFELLAAGDLLPSAEPAPASPSGEVAHSGVTEAFVEAALDQSGDRYVYGAQTKLSDPDPKVFDCSELVRWAGHRSGVDLPDGSWAQFLDLKSQGLLVPVEQGIHTRGALLFSFSTEPEPGGPRPSHSHVAISLGDGSTIEARGRAYGVGSFDASPARFGYAAVLPGTTSTTATSTGDATTTTNAAGDVSADGHGLSPGSLDAAYTAAEPVGLDTDTGHGLSSGSPAVAQLPPDPFVVDSDPQQLSDSLEMLFGDDAHGLGLMPGAEAAADPLGDAVNAALDSVPMTPFDGFESAVDGAAPGAAASSDPAHDDLATNPADHPVDDAADQGLEQHDVSHHSIDLPAAEPAGLDHAAGQPDAASHPGSAGSEDAGHGLDSHSFGDGGHA